MWNQVRSCLYHHHQHKGQKHSSNQSLVFSAPPIPPRLFFFLWQEWFGCVYICVHMGEGLWQKRKLWLNSRWNASQKLSSLNSHSVRKSQFPVLSPRSEPTAQGHSTWVGLQDHRRVFPEINGRAEPKMTEGAPSGMLIYQGFTCWLMIAITVCIWQTQLDMCGEKSYIWSRIILDLYNFLF